MKILKGSIFNGHRDRTEAISEGSRLVATNSKLAILGALDIFALRLKLQKVHFFVCFPGLIVQRVFYVLSLFRYL